MCRASSKVMNGRGALNCCPERFQESCQESDSYEPLNCNNFRTAKHCSPKMCTYVYLLNEQMQQFSLKNFWKVN